MIGIRDITDGIARAVEDAQTSVEEMLFEPVIRLGVTGLSRSGKSVFITALVAGLLNPGRMTQLAAVSEGRLMTAFLQPQPNDAVARFPFEDHYARLTSATPSWPDGTRTISQLRLSLRYQPTGFLTGFTGPRTVHLDIVDYPGEWLLDLALLDQDFAGWSAAALAAARSPARAQHAADWLSLAEAADGAAVLDEVAAQTLANAFKGYLDACRAAGLSGLAPGRFLLPGDLEGSPALTFCPLPPPGRKARGDSLHAAFQRRFEAYKRIVVKPFFRDHFARIERQIVLVDALSAIDAGPRAVEDLRVAMADILRAFRPGANSWLSKILGKRVERILFAATKADHLHHGQHPALTAIMAGLLDDARRRADFSGAKSQAMSIAALRATVEETRTRDGQTLDCVRGTLAETGREAALYAGDLPEDPAAILTAAREGAEGWLDAEYRIMDFAPPRLALKPGDGPPHIRLDRALDFLIGDRLR